MHNQYKSIVMQRAVTFPFSILYSQFVVTDEGSLPLEATENLQSDRIIVDLVESWLRQGKEKTKIPQCLL